MAASGRKNVDDLLALELAAGRTVADAAQAVSLSERTVYRRLDDPAVRRRVSELREDMIGRAVGQLADASTQAVATLAGLLMAESESVRLQAAKCILDIGMKLRESNELEQRIQALEERSGGQPVIACRAS
jgi:HEAT repeat protein